MNHSYMLSIAHKTTQPCQANSTYFLSQFFINSLILCYSNRAMQYF